MALILHPLRPSAVRTAVERMCDLDLLTLPQLEKTLGSDHRIVRVLKLKALRAREAERPIEHPLLQRDLLLRVAAFLDDGASLAVLASLCKITDAVIARENGHQGEALWQSLLRRDFDIDTSDLTADIKKRKQKAPSRRSAASSGPEFVAGGKSDGEAAPTSQTAAAAGPPLPPQCPSKALYGSLIHTRTELYHAEEARRMEESLRRLQSANGGAGLGIDRETWQSIMRTTGLSDYAGPRGWSSYLPSWMAATFWFGGGSASSAGAGGAGGR